MFCTSGLATLALTGLRNRRFARKGRREQALDQEWWVEGLAALEDELCFEVKMAPRPAISITSKKQRFIGIDVSKVLCNGFSCQQMPAEQLSVARADKSGYGIFATGVRSEHWLGTRAAQSRARIGFVAPPEPGH